MLECRWATSYRGQLEPLGFAAFSADIPQDKAKWIETPTSMEKGGVVLPWKMSQGKGRKEERTCEQLMPSTTPSNLKPGKRGLVSHFPLRIQTPSFPSQLCTLRRRWTWWALPRVSGPLDSRWVQTVGGTGRRWEGGTQESRIVCLGNFPVCLLPV